jgi:hypothetical protein
VMNDITVDPHDIRLLHLHIKKTGGQTLNEILERNYWMSRNYALAQLPYDRDAMELLLWFYPHMCFASHSFRLATIPFDTHPVRVITMVRNPVDQILSAYFFCRQTENISSRHPVKARKLDEFARGLMDGSVPARGAFDSQLLQLTGVENTDDALRVVNTCLDEGKTFIFVNERYAESLLILDTLFRGKLNFRMTTKVNVSRKDQKVVPSIRAQLATLPWVDADKRLHGIANKFMDKLIVQLFGSRGKFDERLRAAAYRGTSSRRLLKFTRAPAPKPRSFK